MLLSVSPLEPFPLKPSNHVPSDALKLLYTPLRKMDPGGSSGGGEEVTDGRVTNRSQGTSPAHTCWLFEGGVMCQNPLGFGV